MPNEKINIKFVLDGKPLCAKKFDNQLKLSDLRNKLNKINENMFFIFKDGFKIEKEEEAEYIISDILDNDKIFLNSLDSDTQTINYEINNDTEKLDQLKQNSKRLDNMGNLEIYLYNKIQFSKQEKEKAINLMVVGQTGSGKTTFLNAFLNYLLGVRFEDNFRFKLIHEDFNSKKYDSTTRDVFSYDIRPLIGKIPLITVIDTPGFGDTGGIEKDKKIPDKISKKFKNDISHLNAICFVVQSTNAKLTLNQRYIFNSIMDLFGEDIKENFVAMLTFCNIIDDNPVVLEPLKAKGSGFDIVLPAIEKTQWYFLFDNLAVFKSKENESMNRKIKCFYGFAMENFSEFMKKLLLLPKKDTKKTKNVIDDRKLLEYKITVLEEIVRRCLQKIDEFYQTFRIITQYYDELKNENFRYKIKIIKYRKNYNLSQFKGSGGKYFTTCLVCSRTCHFGCYIASNNEKNKCSAMDNGKCTFCPNKCSWQEHENRDYIWEEYEDIVEKTDEDLKEKYVKKKCEKSKKEQILEGLEKDIIKENSNLIKTQEEMKDTINELRKIALKKEVFENAEKHIDLLIENEKSEHKPGYLERIRYFNILKKQKKQLREIYHGEFNDAKKIEDFLRNFCREEIRRQMKERGCCNIF